MAVFLSGLPLFQPHRPSRMVKNALDHLEDLREDPRPYLDGRAAGCVVTSAGGQAGGVTLSALRSIVHALRGWPTPLGATVTTEGPLPGTGDRQPRADAVDGCAAQLRTVGHQVSEFARVFGAALPTRAGAFR